MHRKGAPGNKEENPGRLGGGTASGTISHPCYRCVRHVCHDSCVMADLSEFHRLSQPKKPPCKMAQALGSERLNDKEKGLLRDALKADPNEITAGGIMHWLAARGVEISSTAVANHRKGRCHCG